MPTTHVLPNPYLLALNLRICGSSAKILLSIRLHIQSREKHNVFSCHIVNNSMPFHLLLRHYRELKDNILASQATVHR